MTTATNCPAASPLRRRSLGPTRGFVAAALPSAVLFLSGATVASGQGLVGPEVDTARGVRLATQSIAAMAPDVRAAILGNVGELVAFRVGAEDAELLQKEFAGRFGPKTLMSLDVGERIVKVGGQEAAIVPADAA